MTGIMGVVSYGLGTIIGFLIVGTLVFWFIQDITQKQHTVLRNYPVIGSWIVGDEPAGMGIREDVNPVTRNTSRFIPHYFD